MYDEVSVINNISSVISCALLNCFLKASQRNVALRIIGLSGELIRSKASHPVRMLQIKTPILACYALRIEEYRCFGGVFFILSIRVCVLCGYAAMVMGFGR